MYVERERERERAGEGVKREYMRITPGFFCCFSNIPLYAVSLFLHAVGADMSISIYIMIVVKIVVIKSISI